MLFNYANDFQYHQTWKEMNISTTQKKMFKFHMSYAVKFTVEALIV